jgi:site-specific recombinase XerC
VTTQSYDRSHVIGWRKDMERRALSGASIRCKLSALSSLFDYLCEHNAAVGNPVDGVKRPMANGNEGSTPAPIPRAYSAQGAVRGSPRELPDHLG